ncbi:MAG: endolytic transglycosylase MltG [Oscillospiraceae bacterium]|nr:endolytic transglycosylase MltG [Oscillospiraceae bacterium]
MDDNKIRPDDENNADLDFAEESGFFPQGDINEEDDFDNEENSKEIVIFSAEDEEGISDNSSLEDPESEKKALNANNTADEISVEEVTAESDDDDNDDSKENYEEYDEDQEYDDEESEEKRSERLRLKEERNRKKRRKRSHGRLIFALVMVTLVISVAVLSAVGVIGIAKEMLGLSREDTEFTVEIPENSGTEAIANLLEHEGIIENPTLFRVISKMKGADGTFMAGVHKVNPNMTYGDLIEELQREPLNPREFVTLTFPEGIRLDDAAAKLEEAGVCKADEFIRTINSAEFGFNFESRVKNSAKKYYKMEGYFFTDTYEFYLDEDPLNVVKKVFRNFDYRVTPDYYGRMEDMDMTLEEVMTLASIVQREASRPRDMKMVASVFYNRLNNPDTFPLLQSDPTSGYARDVVAAGLEVYSQSICDAYDTYKGSGLPPGPICSPGLDAIEAVLYPGESDYYFFCSNLQTGEFYFAETLAEHEQNLVTAGLR